MEGASKKAYPNPEERFDRAQEPLANEVCSQFIATADRNATFHGRTAGMHLQNVDGKQFFDFALSKVIMLLGHSHSRELLCLSQEAGASRWK